jgi:hypothetical protein
MAAFWAVDNWLVVRDATGQSLVDHYARARIGPGSFLVAFFKTPLDQSLQSLTALGVVCCYIGLFTSPIILAGLGGALAGRLRPGRFGHFLARCKPALPALALSIIVCLFSAYYETAVQHSLMPFKENILRFTSVGALGIMGIANSILTPRQKERLTIVSFLLALLVLTALTGWWCLEYDILRDMNVYASHYRGQPPRDTWRWWPIKGEEYIVSFSPFLITKKNGRKNISAI